MKSNIEANADFYKSKCCSAKTGKTYLGNPYCGKCKMPCEVEQIQRDLEAKHKAEMEKLIEEIPEMVTDCRGDGGICGKLDEDGRRWNEHDCEHIEIYLTDFKKQLKAKYLK